MKVILNKDLHPLGEEGDVKDVAKGYARNYLFPRGIALPYNTAMVKVIEGRRAEIEARKEEKRKDSLSLKEKLETLELSITMPAGANGRLYGAVTNQTVADELNKNGFRIERKRIELSGTSIKSVGKYKAAVKLYENQSAEITVVVVAAEIKTETPSAAKQARKGRRDERKEPSPVSESQEAGSTASAESDAVNTEAASSENSASS